MSMWSDEETQPAAAPEGAAFSIDENKVSQNGSVPIEAQAVVEGQAMATAVAAMVLATAALSLALYVYLTRKG